MSELVVISDGDFVYRRVKRSNPPSWAPYRVEGDGNVVFLAAAFNDKGNRPSVDLARLLDFDPHRSRGGDIDKGVVALLVRDVRAIPGPEDDFAAEIDVKHDPRPENPAHAQIEVGPMHDPEQDKAAYRKLKDRLARLATLSGWRVRPGEPLP
jgi:hypothetical protein